MTGAEANPYRLLPAVEEVLSRERVRALAGGGRRELVLAFVQAELDRWRTAIRAGELDAAGLAERLAAGELDRAVERRLREEEGRGVRRAINATGVVLHTGLGRAPVHPEAAEAMARAARSYCVLEVDRFSGRRNQRDERLSELLRRLTGAEAGIAVNNNAAAVLLLLNTFAAGRATIVSRGELVEIGGSFRMPDVMERAGTRLVEVGTTNRTRAADYRAAADADTGLLLKVHSSNFRMVGFTEEVDAAGLAALGRELGLATAFDLGSGLLRAEEALPDVVRDHEPRVREAVGSGVDVVTFSGDKLLGGPQAGLVVGAAAAIARLRKNPMYRALRLDKVSLAGLERTLELFLAGRAREVPARALMDASAAEVRAACERLAASWGALAGLEVAVEPSQAQPGSGSAPGVFLESAAVRVAARDVSAEALAAALRAGEPPVFARVHEGALLFDPRTLLPGDEAELVAALGAAVQEARA